MESSIPANLRCPRSQPRRVAESYTPPYPAWVARPTGQVSRVVMGYFGIQWRGADAAARADSELAQLVARLRGSDGPVHIDWAHETDSAGFENRVAIAYWLDRQHFEHWQNSAPVSQWWLSREDESNSKVGYFREILSPRFERLETLFSSPQRLEGLGVALGQRSAKEICEHAYWGSMRERIPLAQTDALRATGSLSVERGSPASRRVRVSGHENVALIRSGQEWTDTSGQERSLYLEQIEPTLRKGMEFLSREGLNVGCYCNRYLRHVDSQGQLVEKTFGVSLWRALADMEAWAEFHPTHIAIFGTFMRVVQELEFKLKLNLYHEVAVLAPDEQEYEYIHCHPQTGMLRAVAP